MHDHRCIHRTFFPDDTNILNKFEYAGISILMALLIWIMIYPMMIKVDFKSVKYISKNPKGLFVTWIVNWLIKPFTMYGIAYVACYLLKLPHNIAAPAGMIGASNFFELAVAVAIALFGTTSEAALATTVGVLTEVPVMLMLVRIANKTKGRFLMTVKEKAELIVKDIKKERGTNPVVIFKQIAEKEYVSIHGPEHHILDGASLLVAYKNAGGEIDLEQALDRLMAEGLRMPGAMCGLWGICGAITSIGAALAIIDGTGPLSTDGTWGNHMQFTSKAIGELGAINGPRCCKRDAMIAFKNGIDYVNAHYGVTLQYEQMQCGFTDFNEQCIKERCPFYE